jgi:hypothetical protein
MALRGASKTKKWQKSIGSNPPKKRTKKESSRKAQGELKVCLLIDDSRADDSSCLLIHKLFQDL